MAQSTQRNAVGFWKANLRLVATLLAVWFVVSFGFGILLRPALDAVAIGGAPLGFWFAQQGAIYVFVVLIFVYAWRVAALEKRFGVSDDAAPEDQA